MRDCFLRQYAPPEHNSDVARVVRPRQNMQASHGPERIQTLV